MSDSIIVANEADNSITLSVAAIIIAITTIINSIRHLGITFITLAFSDAN